MTDYLELARDQLRKAEAAAEARRGAAYGKAYASAASEYGTSMELAARYERLAAIDAGLSPCTHGLDAESPAP